MKLTREEYINVWTKAYLEGYENYADEMVKELNKRLATNYSDDVNEDTNEKIPNFFEVFDELFSELIKNVEKAEKEKAEKENTSFKIGDKVKITDDYKDTTLTLDSKRESNKVRSVGVDETLDANIIYEIYNIDSDGDVYIKDIASNYVVYPQCLIKV